MSIPRSFRFVCLAATLLAGAPSAAYAQNVVVIVNGEPITNLDIEQRTKLGALSGSKSSDRQQVLDELINEKLKIKEGKKFGVEPSGADIDGSFAQIGSRMRLSPEQLSQMLEGRGIRPETLKQRIKADTVWSSLVRGRYKDSLLVAERDVQNALGGEKAEGESFEYKMRPLVMILPRGSAAPVVEARKKEAEALRGQIQSCADAENTFRSMQNATIRATVVKTSADLPQPLREVLDKTPIGRLTPPEVTRQGIEMVALCGRGPTTADTPKKREIREKMYTEKYEARSKAYLRDIRKSAMIEYR